MGKIEQLEDLIEYFPSGSVRKLSSEYDSPCPFCSPDYGGTPLEYNGILFYGEDRLSWFLDTNTFFCRACQLNGSRYRFTIADVAAKVGAELSIFADFSAPTNSERTVNPIQYRSEFDIYTYHFNVYNKSYWYDFGWDDNTITKFLLGYGVVNESLGNSFVIPMKIRTAERPENPNLYYLTYRTPNTKGSRRLSGTVRDYFWTIQDSTIDDWLVLTEGEKDGISAWTMGFRNFVSSFGTNGWSNEKTQYFYDLGYRKLIIFGDNDAAGKRFAENVYRYAEHIGFDVYVLNYPENSADGYDLTNLLQEYRATAKDYVLNHLLKLDIPKYNSLNTRPTFINDFKEYDPSYEKQTEPTLTLTQLREGNLSIQASMHSFLSGYHSKLKRGGGFLKVIKSPPGTGKTYQSVRIVEEQAMLAMQKRMAAIQELQRAIMNLTHDLENETDAESIAAYKQQIAKLEEKIENFPRASVLWASPYKRAWDDITASGATLSLWHNFEARSELNCQNYEHTLALADNNHNIGTFCQTACPFKEMCKKSGYLAQESARKNKPITFFRHQVLTIPSILSEYRQLLLVDESPLHILERPLIAHSSEIHPHKEGWELEANDDIAVAALKTFADALRVAMNHNIGQRSRNEDGTENPFYVLSGRQFLSVLDSQIHSLTNNSETLQTIMGKIPSRIVSEIYQPNYIGTDQSFIKTRCMPFIFEAINNELTEYANPLLESYNTCIHLVAGELEIYPMKQVKINSATPILITDATAEMPDLYAAMFARVAEVYSPTIRNTNAVTTVIRGSDWTISQIMSQLGKELADRKKRKDTFVLDENGEPFNLKDIPSNPNLYQSDLINDYRDTISALLERHDNLFVVTHKKIRDVIEDIFKSNFPESYQKLAFGHYGALRGTNTFKDFEAAVLIGVPRMPYDVMWRRISAWAHLLGNPTLISKGMSYHASPYHTQDSGHTYYTFDDTFARRYADMYENGEMIQCLERIRPHANDTNKFVYICASRPAGLWVDKVITKTDFLNNYRGTSKVNRVKQYLMREWQEKQTVPSRKEVMAHFTCGTVTFKAARDAAQAELNVQFPSHRR